MRSYDPAELAHLQSRQGVRARLLVWLSPKLWSTGVIEPTGFWNGDDDATFSVGGEARDYFGAGGLLGMDDLTIETGLDVRMINVWLSTAAPEVVEAVGAYDLRLAPVEIHRVLTDPMSHQPIAAPKRIWKGWADGAPRVLPPKGISSGKITIAVASSALMLRRSLTSKYSDEAMRRRGGDRMFRYADVSGKVPVYWGEERIAPVANNGGTGA